ncbi:CU044_2847 family protein [Paractinoplanes hotanensis]|uniref:Trypsin-co-occurring domain-containing protein n=1 Tax=Paractinoplanes hotanensis TaxID=2906497 RepID=A0ABT0XTA1_9ACTN|nr:CU044_2847 family protein [Actinoplanes hotanensis]MCM4076473.1 hypothetical protein [Actinoplanes hotanensis]
MSDGTSVVVAVPDEDGVIPTSSRVTQAVSDAAGSLGKALEPIRAAADEAIQCLREMASSPSTIEIQIGVCLTGQTSAIIASTTAGAQMSVKVIWQRAD